MLGYVSAGKLATQATQQVVLLGGVVPSRIIWDPLWIVTVLHRNLQIVAAIVSLVLSIAIIAYLPLPDYTVFWDAVYDAGHILVFGLFVVFALWLAAAIRGRQTVGLQYVLAMCVSLLTGLAVEWWQMHHDRAAEWVDIFSDVVGITAFAAFFACFDARLRTPRQGLLKRWRLFALAVLLIALGLAPLLRTSQLYRKRAQILPQLMDFAEPWHLVFFYANRADFTRSPPPSGWPSPSPRGDVGRFDARPGNYPGFVLKEPHPDWSPYRGLEIEVFLASTTARDFLLRIHDAAHNQETNDRFRRRFTLEPGFQTLRIELDDVRRGPSSRELDLRRVRGLMLFTPHLDHPLTFFLGEIRLTR